MRKRSSPPPIPVSIARPSGLSDLEASSVDLRCTCAPRVIYGNNSEDNNVAIDIGNQHLQVPSKRSMHERRSQNRLNAASLSHGNACVNIGMYDRA